MGKGSVFVVLTEEAREAYNEDSLVLGFMAGPRHFKCESVVENGSFLDMDLTLDRSGGEPFKFKLSIPTRHVHYAVSSPDGKQLGFIVDENLTPADEPDPMAPPPPRARIPPTRS
jgi:hypothetical protein